MRLEEGLLVLTEIESISDYKSERETVTNFIQLVFSLPVD